MTCSSFDPFSPSELIIGLIFIYIIRDFGLGLAQKRKKVSKFINLMLSHYLLMLAHNEWCVLYTTNNKMKRA